MDEVIITFETLYRDYQNNLKKFKSIKSFSFSSIEFDQFQIEFHSWHSKVEKSKKEVNTFLSCLSIDSFKTLSKSTRYPVHYLE